MPLVNFVGDHEKEKMKTIAIGEDQMPVIGLGTWKMDDGTAEAAVKSAIDVGYRHIDCAAIYLNESEVGAAFQATVGAGKVPREEMWITSKLWCNRHRPELVESGLKQTLADLGLDYLDLYMIHWPIVFRHDLERPEAGSDFVPLSEVPLTDTWAALEDCVDKGLCKHLGVCNFNSDNLKQILGSCRIAPVANQVECHTYLPQDNLKAVCDQNNVVMVGYSPLGSGDRPDRMRDDADPNLFEDAVVKAIAQQRGQSVGQILLAWLVNRGMVAIPKSSNAQRQRENLDAGEIELAADEMSQLDGIEHRHRFVHGRFWEMDGSPYTAAGIWGTD